MLTQDFLRGGRRNELSRVELDTIESSICEVRTLPARKTILRAGERPDECMFLIDGFMEKHIDGDDGARQMLAVHLPGDFVDLHSYPLRVRDHDNATLNGCTVGIVKYERLAAIQQDMPHLAHYLWYSTLLDAAMHREWIFRQSRLNAIGRIAHFFAETERRLQFIGRADDGAFDLPMVQSDLADVTGITAIHVNRCLTALKRDQVLDFEKGRGILRSRARITALSKFNDQYLS